VVEKRATRATKEDQEKLGAEDRMQRLVEAEDAADKDYTRLAWSKMEQYSSQPLDKATAIVCTAFIIDAIKDLGHVIASRSDPQEYGEPWKVHDTDYYDDAPRGWIKEIVKEVAEQHGTCEEGGADRDLIMAMIDEFNLRHLREMIWGRLHNFGLKDALYQLAKADIEPKRDKPSP
jgi:hypothetical protein